VLRPTVERWPGTDAAVLGGETVGLFEVDMMGISWRDVIGR